MVQSYYDMPPLLLQHFCNILYNFHGMLNRTGFGDNAIQADRS